MEDAVPQGIDFEIADAGRGITGAGQHVVPLQDLVQHDAIEESAQAQAEEDAGGNGE